MDLSIQNFLWGLQCANRGEIVSYRNCYCFQFHEKNTVKYCTDLVNDALPEKSFLLFLPLHVLVKLMAEYHILMP